MERYIGTKIVLAEPMEDVTFALSIRSLENVVVGSDGHGRAGYKVVYEDGYTSWSPKETFERAYRRVTDAEIAIITNPDLPGPQ